jgi:NAD(P)-dependent dehydrogenase (short-subunit alcohol dehydrogenase family)
MPPSPYHEQVAVITGASSGIGRAIALALARQGAHVALAARREASLEELAQEVRAMGRQALVVPTDVTSQEQVERLVRLTIERWGRVDVLVASAGQYIRCPISELSPEDVRRSMDINFYGSLYAALAVLPGMRQRRSGRIVFISSLDGKKGLPPDAPYVTAKFALNGFAEVLRQELRGSGVTVTIVLPGRVDTPMLDRLSVPAISAKIPPEAVANAALKAAHRGKPVLVVPAFGSLLYHINEFSPRLGDWAVRFFHLEGWEEKA